jgi:hypothetical protein
LGVGCSSLKVDSTFLPSSSYLSMVDLVLIISMNIADLAGVSRVRDTSYVFSAHLRYGTTLMYRSYYHGPIRGRRIDEPRYEDD